MSDGLLLQAPPPHKRKLEEESLAAPNAPTTTPKSPRVDLPDDPPFLPPYHDLVSSTPHIRLTSQQLAILECPPVLGEDRVIRATAGAGKTFVPGGESREDTVAPHQRRPGAMPGCGVQRLGRGGDQGTPEGTTGETEPHRGLEGDTRKSNPSA